LNRLLVQLVVRRCMSTRRAIAHPATMSARRSEIAFRHRGTASHVI
jgi:hypothetical protein